jgi:hypothetical protein
MKLIFALVTLLLTITVHSRKEKYQTIQYINNDTEYNLRFHNIRRAWSLNTVGQLDHSELGSPSSIVSIKRGYDSSGDPTSLSFSYFNSYSSAIGDLYKLFLPIMDGSSPKSNKHYVIYDIEAICPSGNNKVVYYTDKIVFFGNVDDSRKAFNRLLPLSGSKFAMIRYNQDKKNFPQYKEYTITPSPSLKLFSSVLDAFPSNGDILKCVLIKIIVQLNIKSIFPKF